MHIQTTTLAVFLAFQLNSPAQFWVDFNSSQGGGGTPVPGDPTDPTNAIFQEPGFLCYHATHEDAASFVTANYEVNFALTGQATVAMTPEWPNTTVATVRQSIGRTDGQADSWSGNNVNLLRDWIGADTRTGQSGNGAWDGTLGTPTYFQLRFGGLPAATYEMTAFFHDVEQMNSDFTVEVSVDGGTTFGDPIVGRMTNSQSGGTPAGNEVLIGTAPNVEGGDPADLSSTQMFSFEAFSGEEVVLRIAALSTGASVHSEFVGLNGFKLEQGSASGPGLKVTKVARNSGNGEVTLTWISVPEKSYTIRSSGDLTGDPLGWTEVEIGWLSQGEETSYTDTTAAGDRRFYVIEEL